MFSEESVVSAVMSAIQPEQLDPRRDKIGLYLWGTVVWFALIFLGALVLIVAGNTAML